GTDGKARLYGEHFGRFGQQVVDSGRRPGVWGDMFFDHPSALQVIPRSTLVFDWQYFRSPAMSSALFRQAGFDTVMCPTLHVYNAAWMHIPQSEENVRQSIEAAK